MYIATMDTLDTKNSIDNRQDSYVSLLESSQWGISTYIWCDIRVPLNEWLKGIYNDIKYNSNIQQDIREKLLDKMNSYMDSELSLTLNAPERWLPYLTEYLWKKLREDINNNVVQKNISNEIIFSYYIQRIIFSCLEEITKNNISPFDVKKRNRIKKEVSPLLSPVKDDVDLTIWIKGTVEENEWVDNSEVSFNPAVKSKSSDNSTPDPMEVSKRLIEEAKKKAGLV